MKKSLIIISCLLAFSVLGLMSSSLFTESDCKANFTYETYEFYGEYTYTGMFSLDCGELSFYADASAGYMDDANNVYSYSEKNKGPIPPGTWLIDKAVRNNHRLSLKPIDTKTYKRTAFQIHKRGTIKKNGKRIRRKTKAESSHGCIILDDDDYNKIFKAYSRYGKIDLSVRAIVSGGDQG